ncbi:MAG: right-handed parallel beta-helix repeat-containing protein [Nitrospirota bacterium]
MTCVKRSRIRRCVSVKFYALLLMLALSLFFSSTSSAATRLVVNTAPDTGQGSGGCTSVGNNCSLSRALSQANPNDTIELRVASYNANNRTYTVPKSGMIIRSQAGQKYTISNFATAGTAFTVSVGGVTFQDLILNGGNSTTTGINTSSNNLIINNLTLQNFTGNALYTSGSAAATTVQNTTIEGSDTGIYSSSQTLTVDGSTIRNNTNYGVVIDNVKRNTIQNSTITNNNRGVYWHDSIVQTDADKNQLLNTTISNNATYGVWISSSKFAYIKNCTINNNGKGIVLYGSSVSETYIQQNSIYQNSTGGQGMGIDFNDDGVTTNNGDNSETSMPNNGIDYPVINQISLSGSTLTVRGCSPSNASVELFKADSADPPSYGGNCSFTSAISCGGISCSDTNSDCSNFGQGKVYLGTFTAGSGGMQGQDNCWEAIMDITGKDIGYNDRITATTTISGKGTSEFSRRAIVVKTDRLRLIHWKEVVQ